MRIRTGISGATRWAAWRPPGWAAAHPENLRGLVLLAAYPTKPVDDRLKELLVYGSEDGVLNLDQVAKARSLASEQYEEVVIRGGNHAGIGDYGAQKGDGEATISRAEQQEETARLILRMVFEE